MSQQQFDAVVVGARVAGCAGAAYLSRIGLRVLLLDRVQLPRPTLSCPLFFGNTLYMLDQLGALTPVEAIGAPHIHRYQTNFGPIRLRGRMLPFRGFDYALSIRRELFDAAFLEHTCALRNVETRLGVNVTGLVEQDGRVRGVRASHMGGPEEEIRAGLVVGADGVFSVVARETSATAYDILPARTCVYYAYYSNLRRAEDTPSATIYYDRTIPATFITADGEGGLTVVSLILPASRFEEARQQVDNLHSRYSALFPELADRMSGATRETPMYGVSPRESFRRVPFGPGWALVGDAGYYKDPITGQGIHDALRSAELLAMAVGQTTRGENAVRAFSSYQRTRDRETRAMYRFTDLYAHLDRDYNPDELALFQALAEMPHWSNRFVSLFNGATNADHFTGRANLFAIVTEWRVRRIVQRVTGLPLLQKANVPVHRTIIRT